MIEPYHPVDLPSLLSVMLHDQPTIYIEDLLKITKDNQHVMGGLLISILESILRDREQFKEFTDEMINIAKENKNDILL